MPAAEVAVALGIDILAVPCGFRVSRAPRTRLLRSARVTVAGRPGDVRVRDISTTGAMVDGLALGGDPVGTELLIELVEHHRIAARVRWADRGRVGLQFAEPIDLSLLAAPGPVGLIRRTG